MEGSPLWVWKFDIAALVGHVERMGFRLTHRIAGSFTELQRRLKGPLRTGALLFNNGWYSLRLPAGPCATNLLVFQKMD